MTETTEELPEGHPFVEAPEEDRPSPLTVRLRMRRRPKNGRRRAKARRPAEGKPREPAAGGA